MSLPVLNARHVIAQVNRRMPRTHGDGLIHVDSIHSLVEHDEELPSVTPHPPTQVDRKIGGYCAELVEDGATLAMLRDFGVDYSQGYYVGRPRPLALALA